MREPDVYTHANSSFGEGPYKRLEINVSADDPLLLLSALNKIIQEHFPGITHERISFGHHWRSEGRGGKNFLMFVLQFNGTI